LATGKAGSIEYLWFTAQLELQQGLKAFGLKYNPFVHDQAASKSPRQRRNAEIIESLAASGMVTASGGASARVTPMAGLVPGAWNLPRHHGFPEYLGGDPDQPLTRIPRWLHDDFHRFVDGFATGEISRQKTALYFSQLPPEELLERQLLYLEACREYDRAHPGWAIFEEAARRGGLHDTLGLSSDCR
jgi:hypothetical protein